jgi:hypothetical protein
MEQMIALMNWMMFEELQYGAPLRYAPLPSQTISATTIDKG